VWQEHFQNAFDQAAIGMALVSLDGKWLRVNPALCRIVGYSPEELLVTDFQSITHRDDLAVDLSYVGQMVRGEIRSYEMENRYVHKGGHIVWVLLSVSLVYDQQSDPLFFFSQIQEITGRKRVEEALRQSERRFRDLVENTKYGIYHSTREGRFVDVNPALVRMLGYSSEEELLAVDLAADVYGNPEDRARVLELGQQTGRISEAEVEWKRKDGRPITVRISGRALYDQAGQLVGTEGIIENVTEWRETEKQLRQAQKMEAVGRLSGGIAHDFNNLLTVIKGYSDILSGLRDQCEPYRHSVEQIRKAADRAASLTRQLLAFSRMQVLQPKVLDLNEAVLEMEKMLARLIGEHIEFVFVPDKSLGRTKADPGQIEQVIVNLAVNARDAMPHGGKLIIETRNIFLDGDYVLRHPPALAGEYVMLSVSDTGHGMDAETQSHIFEPFFTTKEQGKGTGLGLATVYGIVKQSGGYIWVYSEPGLGAAFKIYLPRVCEAPEITRPIKSAVGVAGGTETLLLAEDQEDVRELMSDFLRKSGYTVLPATNGAEAMQIAERYDGPIHLLVTDVVMPKMGGRELAERLVGVRPQVKVLYLSGYSEYSAAPLDSKDWRDAFLQKPFAVEQLAGKIREVLAT
jgi:two-component system, cell cycle sensor histidine kinase and response regulator CckA